MVKVRGSAFSRFFRLFSNKKKPRAAAFVDYEHWYISMNNMFYARPALKQWHQDITEQFDVSEIVFFGDFSGPLKQELDKIRVIADAIVDTRNPSGYYKKDYTDFIMLDYIYRKSVCDPKLDTYIIFTGDGHFSLVVNFLRSICKKNVVMYGIKGAISALLKNEATRFVELPEENAMEKQCMKLIAENFKYVASQPAGRIFPTFQSTCGVISRSNNLPYESVKGVLKKMLDKGYVKYRMERVSESDEVRILYADWDRLAEDGVWKAPG